MKQRLALTGAAGAVAGLAVALDLPDVPTHRLPALDLPPVFVSYAAPHVVAAIPLEPAAGIVGMDPSLRAPDRERLAGIDAVVIERAVAPSRRELGAIEPIRRKLTLAVSHVLAAEYAQSQHLFRRELGPEFRIEVPPHGLRQLVAVAPLHPVVHDHAPGFTTSHARVVENRQALRERKILALSRFQSRSFSAARLSDLRLPLARPIATLAIPRSLK